MNPIIAVLNGLSLNAGANGFMLDEPISGLEIAEIRTSSGINSGQDGGYVGAQLFGNRYITLTGRVRSTETADIFEQRKTLENAISGLGSPMPLTIQTYDGKSYAIDVYLTKFDMPIDRHVNRGIYKIELLAPDPIIYDTSAGSSLVADLQRAVAGGFTWPISWPLVWSAATGPVTVTNSGTVFVKPKIILNDIMTNPVVTNLTTGQFIGLTGLTTAPGDEVVIDMRERQVTLNGGNIYDKVASGSEWWGLPVGPSDIKLETGSGSDDTTGTISWRNGVAGI